MNIVMDGRQLRPAVLRNWFCDYNERYFDSVLPTCDFSVVKSCGYLGLFQSAKGSRQAEICFPSRPVWTGRDEWSEQMLREILIHEMVHYYVEEIIGRHLMMFAHGYKYRKVCRRLRKRHGVHVHISAYRYKKTPSSFRGKVARLVLKGMDNLFLLFF